MKRSVFAIAAAKELRGVDYQQWLMDMIAKQLGIDHIDSNTFSNEFQHKVCIKESSWRNPTLPQDCSSYKSGEHTWSPSDWAGFGKHVKHVLKTVCFKDCADPNRTRYGPFCMKPCKEVFGDIYQEKPGDITRCEKKDGSKSKKRIGWRGLLNGACVWNGLPKFAKCPKSKETIVLGLCVSPCAGNADRPLRDFFCFEQCPAGKHTDESGLLCCDKPETCTKYGQTQRERIIGILADIVGSKEQNLPSIKNKVLDLLSNGVTDARVEIWDNLVEEFPNLATESIETAIDFTLKSC